MWFFFFFSSRRRHTRLQGDWSSDVCSSDLPFNSGSARQLYMRRSLLFDALKNYKTRLIWLDEAQHLLYQRRSEMSNEWENDATEFLRELVDECKLSLVLAGTSELDNLPEVAPHLSSRVSGRESMDNFIADANWVGFVRGFVKQCQSFDLTCMNDVQMAMRLHMEIGRAHV